MEPTNKEQTSEKPQVPEVAAVDQKETASKEEKPKKAGEPEEEVIDENEMDCLADQMEQKLNLTAGERDKEDDLDPEMDKYFENFMQTLQQQDPEGGEAFKSMADMMKGMFGGLGEGMPDDKEPGDPNDPEEQKFDKMTDMLLEQFMEKDILYEPLLSAKKELDQNLLKEPVDQKDRDQMKAQLNIINQLIDTFDKEPNNKPRLIQLFEEMNKVGSFMDIISKYSPEHSSKQNAFGDLNNLLGGGAGLPPGAGSGKPGEDCTLI